MLLKDTEPSYHYQKINSFRQYLYITHSPIPIQTLDMMYISIFNLMEVTVFKNHVKELCLHDMDLLTGITFFMIKLALD